VLVRFGGLHRAHNDAETAQDGQDWKPPETAVSGMQAGHDLW